MPKTLGQNWLLLRGLSREAAHWGEFLDLMQAAFPSANIATIDLPGAGRFHRQSSPDNIADITDSVRRQAHEQGLLQRPTTLLAMSLGGMVAWEWLLKYPNDINGAVLINTSFANLSPFYRRLRWQSYGHFAKILLETGVCRRESAIVHLVSNRRDRHDETAEQWGKIQTERPIGLKNSLNQIVAAATYKPSSARPHQPVLLLNSQGDRLVSPLCSEAIARHWQLELHTHPWAGHDLSLDDGDWVVSRVKEWRLGQHYSVKDFSYLEK